MRPLVIALFLTFFPQAHGKEQDAMGLLEEMVNVPSGTSQKAGLESIRGIVTKAFKKIGYAPTLHRAEDERKVLSFAVSGSQPDIMLLGHLDTVFTDATPAPKFRVDGDKVFGGGVIDMKGGIALMYDLLSDLDPQLRRRVQIVLNDEEETGSLHTRSILRQLAKGKRSILVFEPGTPDGAVVSSQSGVRWMNLTVQGKAAHAGLEHEKGYNACVELSHKIAELAKLTDYAKRLTINVGTIQGGMKPNVVCEKATVGLDIRFVQPDDLEMIMVALKRIAATTYTHNAHLDFTPTTTTDITSEHPSLPESATAVLMAKLKDAAPATKQSAKGVHVGYASDANELTGLGADILVGLGPYGGGMHTKDEFMSLSGYRDRWKLNLELLRLLTRN